MGKEKCGKRYSAKYIPKKGFFAVRENGKFLCWFTLNEVFYDPTCKRILNLPRITQEAIRNVVEYSKTKILLNNYSP